MAHNLAAFKVDLRRAHKRGTALDADLNGAIRRAASWIEKNYTFQYMRRIFNITLQPNQKDFDIADLKIKTVFGIRWDTLDTYGHYYKATKIEFDQLQYPSTRHYSHTTPTEFYLDGANTLVFTTMTSEALSGTGMLAQYSDFPQDDDESHWLLENAESALLCRAMLELGLISRDDRMYAVFQQHLMDELKVALNADYETRYAGQDISVSP